MTITIDEVIQILKNDIELSKMNALFCHNNEYGIGALQMAIETLEQTRWIPCSERLPEDGAEVFVYLFDNSRPHIAWIEDTHWYTEDFEIERENEPFAWMPLPQPYREIQHTCSECIIKDTDACSRGNTEADEVACEDFVGGESE